MLTPEERKIYRTVDSLVASSGDSRVGSEAVRFGVSPVFEFDRVGSVTLGAGISAELANADAAVTAAYSFGLRRPVGDLSVSLTPIRGTGIAAGVRARIFSHLEPFFVDPAYPRILSSAAATLLHIDYFDWVRRDGVSAEPWLRIGDLSATVTGSITREFSEQNRARRSLFAARPFRDNPHALPGEFRVLQARLRFGEPDAVLVVSNAVSSELSAGVTGLIGDHLGTGARFGRIHGNITWRQPTAAS